MLEVGPSVHFIFNFFNRLLLSISFKSYSLPTTNNLSARVKTDASTNEKKNKCFFYCDLKSDDDEVKKVILSHTGVQAATKPLFHRLQEDSRSQPANLPTCHLSSIVISHCQTNPELSISVPIESGR
jgi:hypothetical protein